MEYKLDPNQELIDHSIVKKKCQYYKFFKYYTTLVLIGLCYFVQESQQQSTISINNTPWILSNANGSIVVPAQVPGGVYSDLRRGNILKQDILYGKNDIAYRWVGHENWTYTTAFVIDHQIARSQSVKLVLHGIDTVATLFLNGQEIGTTDNMFVRYKFDIKPHLKLAGLDNVLVVKFESPIKYSARKSHQSIRQNRGKLIPPYCPSPAQRGECHVNFIRKMQASFSWDWGPAYPSMGIYKNIDIEYGSFGIIRDILVDTRRLSPLVQPTRSSSQSQPVIISSSIRQNLRTPTINKTVPYMRAPPYYVALNNENHHLMEQAADVVDITLPIDTSQQLLEENWLMKTTLVAEMVQANFGYNLRVEFNLNGVLNYESEHINVVANSDGYIRLGFNLRIDSSRLRVQPWWPNNAGSQTLYRLTARMMPIPNSNGPPEHIRIQTSRDSRDTNGAHPTSDSTLQSRARPPQSQAPQPAAILATQLDASTYQQQYTSTKEISFGFRTVELIQEPVTRGNPEEGLTFNLRINGIDLFAMGSNWIPASILPENSNDLEYIRYLLQSAKDANMNMLRVWGGGLYESDEFYKMADEMGIMIWHDFMFACALYPADDEFLASVRLEIEQQVQRLQYHPSIVLWAGNNENEMAIAGPWWPEVMLWNKKLREFYSKLYVDTIRPIVQILDPTRPYVESSPSNGILSESQPNAIARVPNDNKYGDVHHYDYFMDSFEWTSYPNTRFASEYGFQSYPSFNALSSVTTPSDWKYPLTANILHRQHRLTGETEIKHQIKLHFDELQSGGVTQFKSFIYLSQLTQAIAIKTETEFYRRNRFIDPETKLGKTMGALYWQLNDVWAAPTWSSIEHGGKWKMLHYFARRFFFPIQVIPFLMQGAQTSSSMQASSSSMGGIMQALSESSPSILSSLSGGGGRPRNPLTQHQINELKAIQYQQQQQQQQQQQPQSQQSSLGSSIFAVDLIRDDLFYLLDSFNVTIRFYRWTSFSPVWQDTVYVKNTRPQNVTRIYEQEVSRIVRQPGVISLSSGVFQVIIEQQPRLGLSQIENYLMPVIPSRITAMRVARISAELIQGPFELTDVRSDAQVASAQWSCAYRLTLVSDSIAMFVWLDLNLLNVQADSGKELEGSRNEYSNYEQNEHRQPSPQATSTLVNLRPQPGQSPPDKIILSSLPSTQRHHQTISGNLGGASGSSNGPTQSEQFNPPAEHIHLHLDHHHHHMYPDLAMAGKSDSPMTINGANDSTQHATNRMAKLLLVNQQYSNGRRYQQQQPINNKTTFKPVDGSMGGAYIRYQFSDNAFNMFEPSKVIDLYLSKCLSKMQVEVALEIQSLADVL